LNDDLKRLFQQSSSVSFIEGERDSGKTDFGCLLLETGKGEGIFDKIAANVATRNDPILEYICYFDRLEDWLKTPGKKAFLLDEMGQHLYRMSFMSRMAKKILAICQLVRKFDAHFIGIAPSADFVNKLFFNTDILDCRMKKLSRKICYINNRATRSRLYKIKRIRRTSIKFLTKDIALFGEKDPNKAKEQFANLPSFEQAAQLYLRHRSLRKVANIMGISHSGVAQLLNTKVKRLNTCEVVY